MSKSTSHPQTPSYLSPHELANALGVTPRTVYNWIQRGEIEASKFGGVWRIPKSVLTEGRENTDEGSGTCA